MTHSVLSLTGDPLAGLRAMRTALIKRVYGQATIPTLTPPSIVHNYNNSDPAMGAGYAASFPADCNHTDAFFAATPAGGRSPVHVAFPAVAWNGNFAFVHGGHSIDYYSSAQRMDTLCHALLTAGYAVVGVCMPCSGFSPQPLVLNLDAGGTISVATHDDFASVESVVSANTLRFFVDPAIVALQYLRATYPSAKFFITGISGGGFTVNWLAAMCPEFTRTCAIKGSLTFPLYAQLATGLDYEQKDPSLTASAEVRGWWAAVGNDFENLYALGALEPGRISQQGLGIQDPDFPAETIVRAIGTYSARAGARVGDRFSTRVDDSPGQPGHLYTDGDIAAVLAVFAA